LTQLNRFGSNQSQPRWVSEPQIAHRWPLAGVCGRKLWGEGQKGASRAVEAVLKQLGQWTDPTALQALAQALQALAAKLSEAQASHALNAVASSLAWAASDDEAVEWARALVALSAPLSVHEATKELIAAALTQWPPEPRRWFYSTRFASGSAYFRTSVAP
jgi:hypothetical protein